MYLYCTPIEFAVQPDCRPPARYFPEGITVNPGGLQYKSDFIKGLKLDIGMKTLHWEHFSGKGVNNTGRIVTYVGSKV